MTSPEQSKAFGPAAPQPYGAPTRLAARSATDLATCCWLGWRDGLRHVLGCSASRASVTVGALRAETETSAAKTTLQRARDSRGTVEILRGAERRARRGTDRDPGSCPGGEQGRGDGARRMAASAEARDC